MSDMDLSKLELTAPDFLAARQENPPPSVIDLRDTAAYEAAHLSGSRLIPLSYLAEEAIFFAPGRRYLLYGASAEQARSGAQLLAQRGLKQVGFYAGAYEPLQAQLLAETGALWLERNPQQDWPGLIEQVLDQRVRPMLEQDGGGLHLAELQGDKLYVDFTGNCKDCESSRTATLRLVQMSLCVGLNRDLKVIARRPSEVL